MKSVDERAITGLGVPSLTLMEHAGASVVAEMENVRSIRRKKIVVFAGKGNNGGDGFVVARIAYERGATVTVVLFEKPDELKGDALVNFNRLNPSSLTIMDIDDFLSSGKRRYDYIVDAIFGTSFHGALHGRYSQAVEWINSQKAGSVIAVDIPSGLDGETGIVESVGAFAETTVTFSNPKIGFYRANAKEYTGTVRVADIGIPTDALTGERSDIFLVEENDCRTLMPTRRSNSHKHSVGKVFILAGSKGMMGAALMSSLSAMKAGAGQVILGIPDSEYGIVAKRTLEVMPLGLACTEGGSISSTAFSEIQKRIEWADVLVMGCGLSQHPETKSLIMQIIETCPKPMVIDADGLNALAENVSLLKNRQSQSVVLTPHHGEFSRLAGIPSSEIEPNKFDLARDFARKYAVTLILKGAPTLTATSTGHVFVNPTGNPGMSTAGSGDVLAGVVGACMGQSLTPESASILGVYIHGYAGDVAKQKKGIQGMIARDIIGAIPAAFKRMIQ